MSRIAPGDWGLFRDSLNPPEYAMKERVVLVKDVLSEYLVVFLPETDQYLRITPTEFTPYVQLDPRSREWILTLLMGVDP